MSFTWIPLYSEIARKVLEFENRQSELLGLLGRLKADGLKVVALTDRDASGKEIPLGGIDPFTFFASFNRTSSVSGRQAILAKIKDAWQLPSPVPDDFDGIPIANAQNSWAFAYLANRTPNDIPILWRAARQGVEQGWQTFDRNLFDEALNVGQMGLAKLTMSLFWLNPHGFLPCDKHTGAYFKRRGIVWESKMAAGYFPWLEKAIASAGENFPQVSLDAYEADAAADEESNGDDTAVPRDEPSTGPRFVRFFGLVLDALRSMGGTGTPKAVTDWIAEQKGVSDSERDERMSSGASRFKNHVDWARFYLSKAGLVGSAKRGIWTLTAAGQTAHPSMPECLELFQRVQALMDEETPDAEPTAALREEETRSKRIWLLSPGAGAALWEQMHSEGIMAIGWSELGDLRNYQSRDQISERLIVLEPDRGKRWNDTLACWEFAREIRAGDIVVAKGGMRRVLGYGMVRGEYEYDATRDDFRNRRAVEWLGSGEWVLPDERQFPVKTLTEVGRDPEFVRDLENALGVSFARLDPPPNTSASGIHRYWWLNANPKIWDFRSAPIGSIQTYTSHNKDGNKRQKYKHFAAVQPGDLLLGYVTNPDKEIVAVCEVTKALHGSPGHEAIEFKKIEQFQEPVTWAELQSAPALAHCEPLISNQGSLFALTEDEYDTIRALIDERPPDPERAPYTKADALNGLFMTESQLDTILARLRRKKAIILQGPPGVGKTFIARRLAWAMMGERDKRRVAMVQFHPSYGYEDFVQGYRPTRTGLERRDGVFCQFARLARNDPERDYFFVIDEINRGNLTKIFGEVLMLIEADKRGSEHAIPLTYSETADETFHLAANVHFIGTMNTADRSLAMVDYALRRRFAFVTLDPALDSPAFAEWLKDRNASDALIARIRAKVGILNAVIDKARDLGPGFRIGHSFFCPPDGHSPDEAWYREVIAGEIQPLLEEYFDSRERVEELVAELLR